MCVSTSDSKRNWVSRYSIAEVLPSWPNAAPNKAELRAAKEKNEIIWSMCGGFYEMLQLCHPTEEKEEAGGNNE